MATGLLAVLQAANMQLFGQPDNPRSTAEAQAARARVAATVAASGGPATPPTRPQASVPVHDVTGLFSNPTGPVVSANGGAPGGVSGNPPAVPFLPSLPAAVNSGAQSAGNAVSGALGDVAKFIEGGPAIVPIALGVGLAVIAIRATSGGKRRK